MPYAKKRSRRIYVVRDKKNVDLPERLVESWNKSLVASYLAQDFDVMLATQQDILRLYPATSVEQDSHDGKTRKRGRTPLRDDG